MSGMTSVLLDTHILVWWFIDPKSLTAVQRLRLEEGTPERPLAVITTTLWEVSMLHRRRRVDLGRPLRDWLDAATAAPLMRVLPITPAIATEESQLPDTFHGDPADRLLVATARVHHLPLITSDARIRASGLVQVI